MRKTIRLGYKQCPACAKRGRDRHEDNLAVYEDGSCYCYSCGYKEQQPTPLSGEGYKQLSLGAPTTKAPSEPPPMPDVSDGPPRIWRGITSNTFAKYECYDSGGALIMPYGTHSFKARHMKDKRFYGSPGAKQEPLFGMRLFPEGGRIITVTEGELDAMAYYEMTGYPAVSIQGASSAHRDLTAAYDWLMTFDVIKIVFDNDVPGQSAASIAMELFPAYKVANVKLTQHKDTNAYLEADQSREFLSEWWAAKPKRPKNILSTQEAIFELIDEEQTEPIATYPFVQLNNKLDGMREGELNFWLAHTGQGKTEVMRAIEYHLLKTTGYNIGVMHLEEQPKRVVDGFLTYHLKQPMHLRKVTGHVTKDDKKKAWADMTDGKDRVHIFKMFGGEEVQATLDLIRYMVVAQRCKVIFLDHISIMVSGSTDGDERRTLDMLTTQLAILAQELKCVIHAVSHVNDDGKARSSRNAEKVAHNLVFIKRDIENVDENVRNTTDVMVRKARYTGDTGPAGQLFFDKGTCVLTEKEDEDGPEEAAAVAEAFDLTDGG